MNKDLKKILNLWALMIFGCIIICLIIHTFPFLSSVLFGYGWCKYIQNKKGV